MVGEEAMLSPLLYLFDDVDTEHPESVKMLNELVQMDGRDGLTVFIFGP